METKDGKYLVHFNGWPKKYDRWVPPESIIKQNEMNRALMKMNNKSNKEREDKPYYKMSILNELVVFFQTLYIEFTKRDQATIWFSFFAQTASH